MKIVKLLSRQSCMIHISLELHQIFHLHHLLYSLYIYAYELVNSGDYLDNC